VNLQVRSWFDSGHIAEAILGGEPYFLRDHTWIDRHDRVLVFQQLLSWADDDDKLARAAVGLRAALVTALADDDASAVYDILWTYFVVIGDEGDRLPLDFDEIGRWLDQLETRTIPDGDEIAGVRRNVRDRIPTTQNTAWDRHELPGRFMFLPREFRHGDQYKILITAPDHITYLEGDVEVHIPADLDAPTIRLHRDICFTKPFERAATEAERDVIMSRVQQMLRSLGKQLDTSD